MDAWLLSNFNFINQFISSNSRLEFLVWGILRVFSFGIGVIYFVLLWILVLLITFTEMVLLYKLIRLILSLEIKLFEFQEVWLGALFVWALPLLLRFLISDGVLAWGTQNYLTLLAYFHIDWNLVTAAAFKNWVEIVDVILITPFLWLKVNLLSLKYLSLKLISSECQRLSFWVFRFFMFGATLHAFINLFL